MGLTGDTLKRARQAAGMTQAELASRAGTRQGAISAYETGKRDPTVGTLRRLLRATGHDLNLSLEPLDRTSGLVPGSRLRRDLAANREAIRRIVAARGGSNVRVFGSVARGDDHEGSDLDLLVDLPAQTGFLTIGAIARDVERLLGVEVDVVPEGALRSDFRESILNEATSL